MSAFVGTGRLVRLVLRRDRWRLAIWFSGLVLVATISAAQVRSLYDTPAKVATYVDTFGGNPALVTFAGPGYGFDHPTTGVILVNEASLWMAICCGLMSVFLVNRHTRAEEDSERSDLVRSAIVGRHAPVTSALLVAAGINAAVATATTPLIVAIGYPARGTIALTTSFAAVGFVFAAATAVTAQLASSGRSAIGLGAGSVGLAYVARGIGDIHLPALSWLTPFGWGIGVRAFAGERWWVIPGLVAFAAALVVCAFALSTQRDLGSGLLRARRGRPHAGPWLTSPLGLAWRLQRASIGWWCSGLLVTGLAYGSIGKDVERLLTENSSLADYLAQLQGVSIVDSYLATALRMLAMLAGGFAVSSALRTRSDEAAGYAESMLAASVGRARWTASHLIVTIAGTAAVVTAAGLGAGAGYAISIGDVQQVTPMVEAALGTLPALLVLVGVAVVLFGWLPHAAGAAWGALAVVVVVGVFASVLHLPRWALRASPLESLPLMPAQPWNVVPFAVLTAIAVSLIVVGILGFTRRDLAAA
jgi:ABC-2 type transport system permease protein